MDSFINIFQCWKKEEVIDSQKKSEINVLIDSNPNKLETDNNNASISIMPESSDIRGIDSSHLKLSDINNTTNRINENSLNAKKNNKIINMEEINQKIDNIILNSNRSNKNEEDIFTLQSHKGYLSPGKENSKNYYSNTHMNINKIINNNNSSKNNIKNCETIKNISFSSVSKVNKSNNKDSSSNKGTVLTLNDLVLISQNPEEKPRETGSKLLLSGELFFWKEIILQTNGIKNSLRKEKDDHVFFGLKNKTNYPYALYNDLFINFFWSQDDAEIYETTTGRVFEIYYNKKLKEYTLNFLHPNLILHYKINNFVYFNIGKEYYLRLGNVFITINVKKTTPIEKTIMLIVEIDNKKPMKFSFTQNQTPIKIGRMDNNEIAIFCPSISKNHGIIEYSKNSQSFYYKDMGSTNKSILYIQKGDYLKIKGEMNFKLEDVPFKIQEIP